ncbi:hypothetical protein F5882DRAFT_399272 [Hyaloscypha sp. PMI_1271]|nr:hypothetical protein F5882DRAFT_399272 [Hyaloscypha sp. PMI_1271]
MHIHSCMLLLLHLACPLNSLSLGLCPHDLKMAKSPELNKICYIGHSLDWVHAGVLAPEKMDKISSCSKYFNGFRLIRTSPISTISWWQCRETFCS